MNRQSFYVIATLAELVMPHNHFRLTPCIHDDDQPEYCRLLTWSRAPVPCLLKGRRSGPSRMNGG